jgi:hypothetical protein
VNITEEIATFSRAAKREQAYIDFFSSLRNNLITKVGFPVRDTSLASASWLNVYTLTGNKPGLASGTFTFSFAQGRRFRVELYIDSSSQEQNKHLFDLLYLQKEVIEADLGEPVQWERLNDRRASRIAIYHPGSIEDDHERLAELQNWAVTTMIRFEKTFSEHLNHVLNES